jgi:hypothetical protein
LAQAASCPVKGFVEGEEKERTEEGEDRKERERRGREEIGRGREREGTIESGDVGRESDKIN